MLGREMGQSVSQTFTMFCRQCVCILVAVANPLDLTNNRRLMFENDLLRNIFNVKRNLSIPLTFYV